MSSAIVKRVQGSIIFVHPLTKSLAYFRQISKTLQFRVLDSQSIDPWFKTTWWLQGRLDLSSVQSISLIKWIPGTPRNLVVKSELSPCSGSAAFRPLNPVTKRSHKVLRWWKITNGFLSPELTKKKEWYNLEEVATVANHSATSTFSQDVFLLDNSTLFRLIFQKSFSCMLL